MAIGDWLKADFLAQAGQEMYDLIVNLYPICRSITGEGIRQTLRTVQGYIPLEMYEVPSGTQVFDWTVPPEWNIRDAYVKDSQGERVIDFQQSNLHVVNYSVPVRAQMSLAELKEHLYSLPDHPDWVPYRTTYYNRNWGFCLSHNQLLQLPEDTYEVCIDSSLDDAGHLTYGELLLPGKRPEEILFSCHACHPSLCNDNLSGISLVTLLAKHLQTLPHEYSYRFLLIPGTIGSITWLSRHQQETQRIKHGLVVACVGDPGGMTYKKTRDGDAEIDRAVAHVLTHSGKPHEIVDFIPYGYDERQYGSPGFNLHVGSLMRTPNGRYPEYHTSADNLDLVRPEYLIDSLMTYLKVLYVLENNKRYVNLSPYGEPQLGKLGLYQAIGGGTAGQARQLATLWVLNQSDGEHSLLDIAERAGMDFEVIQEMAEHLAAHGLLREIQV
jgi:aminopeptidase-like protein